MVSSQILADRVCFDWQLVNRGDDKALALSLVFVLALSGSLSHIIL